MMLKPVSVLNCAQSSFLKILAASAAVMAAASNLLLPSNCSATLINLGQASNFAVLFEGGGTNNHIGFNNSTLNGNVGIGGAGGFAGSSPGTITGLIEFSAANTGQSSQFSNSGVTLVPSAGNPIYSQSIVTSALNAINSLSTNFGA
jgi:hypothetical protein